MPNPFESVIREGITCANPSCKHGPGGTPKVFSTTHRAKKTCCKKCSEALSNSKYRSFRVVEVKEWFEKAKKYDELVAKGMSQAVEGDY